MDRFFTLRAFSALTETHTPSQSSFVADFSCSCLSAGFLHHLVQAHSHLHGPQTCEDRECTEHAHNQQHCILLVMHTCAEPPGASKKQGTPKQIVNTMHGAREEEEEEEEEEAWETCTVIPHAHASSSIPAFLSSHPGRPRGKLGVGSRRWSAGFWAWTRGSKRWRMAKGRDWMDWRI